MLCENGVQCRHATVSKDDGAFLVIWPSDALNSRHVDNTIPEAGSLDEGPRGVERWHEQSVGCLCIVLLHSDL